MGPKKPRKASRVFRAETRLTANLQLAPCRSVKKAREAELSRDAARENDGFESVPHDDQKNRDARDKGARSWNHVRHFTGSLNRILNATS